MAKKPSLALRKPPKTGEADAFVFGDKSESKPVALVAKQEVTKSTSQPEELPEYRRATYYLRPEQIRALKLKAVTEERNLSEVVREAVDAYLQA